MTLSLVEAVTNALNAPHSRVVPFELTIECPQPNPCEEISPNVFHFGANGVREYGRLILSDSSITNSHARVSQFEWDFRVPQPYNWWLTFDNGVTLDMDIESHPTTPVNPRAADDVLSGTVTFPENIIGAHILIWQDPEDFWYVDDGLSFVGASGAEYGPDLTPYIDTYLDGTGTFFKRIEHY